MKDQEKKEKINSVRALKKLASYSKLNKNGDGSEKRNFQSHMGMTASAKRPVKFMSSDE